MALNWRQAHRMSALFDAHRDDSKFGYRVAAGEAVVAGWLLARGIAGSLASQTGPGPRRNAAGVATQAGPGPSVELVGGRCRFTR